PRGALLSLFGLGTLLFAIIEGPERGWTDPFVVGSFLAAALLLTAFVRWEQVAPHPMLPLTFFSDRRFSVGSAVITTAFFLMFGWFFLFSLSLQCARGDSPLDAGLATLPFAAVLVLVSPRSAAIGERLGGGLTIAAGFALIALGMAVFTVIGVSTPYLVLVGAMVLMAAGMAGTAPPAPRALLSAVPLAQAGVGSAVDGTTPAGRGALPRAL